MARGQQSRCACTLPFSLHLTVMILGIIGFILTVAVTVLVFQNADWYSSTGNSASGAKGSAIWLLLSTIVIVFSGLQGLLVRPGTIWFGCHIFLAVINLINLGVLIVAFCFIGSAFWIIYMVAVFVFELWATILRTCCKAREEPVVGMTELPVANPGGAQGYGVQGYAVDMPVSGHPYPQTYKVDPRPEAAGIPYPAQGRAYDRFEEVR